MSQEAVFFHPGCPVCICAGQQFAKGLDPARYGVEIAHLGERNPRVAEAEAAGVESVPAQAIGGRPFHINFNAAPFGSFGGLRDRA